MFPALVYQGISMYTATPVAPLPTSAENRAVTICLRLWPVRSFSTPSVVQRHLTAIPFLRPTRSRVPPWNPTATYSRDMLSQPGIYITTIPAGRSSLVDRELYQDRLYYTIPVFNLILAKHSKFHCVFCACCVHCVYCVYCPFSDKPICAAYRCSSTRTYTGI